MAWMFVIFKSPGVIDLFPSKILLGSDGLFEK